MKTTLILLTLLAMAFLWLACKHPKYTPGYFPDVQLRWGHGGGITGRETTFTLLDNGQIFRLEQGGKLTETGQIKSKKAKEFYRQSEALGLSQVVFQYPGNTYQFMETVNGDAMRRISWGAKDHPVDPKIQDLYNQLNALTGQ